MNDIPKLYVDTKPKLAWEGTDRLTASTPFGVYTVVYLCGPGLWGVGLSGIENYLAYVKHGENEAKAAAQADYDRRKAEMFKEVEWPEDGGEGLVEAATFLGLDVQEAAGWRACISELEDNARKALEGGGV